MLTGESDRNINMAVEQPRDREDENSAHHSDESDSEQGHSSGPDSSVLDDPGELETQSFHFLNTEEPPAEQIPDSLGTSDSKEADADPQADQGNKNEESWSTYYPVVDEGELNSFLASSTPPVGDFPTNLGDENTSPTDPADEQTENTSKTDSETHAPIVISNGPNTAEVPPLHNPNFDSGTLSGDTSLPLNREALSATTEFPQPDTAPPASKAGSSKAHSSKSNAKTDDEQPARSGVPLIVFIIVLSYASVATIACFYLLQQLQFGSPHQLESLPDIKPPMKNDEIAYQLVPEGGDVAPGHVLELGESRRFGDLLITPMKVTMGTLTFEHYTLDPERVRAPVEGVCKLWLKIENKSEESVFAPFDRQLILTRVTDSNDPSWLRSNNFVARQDVKGSKGEQHLLYDLEMAGEWNFAGIPDNVVLKPGEATEIYLPTEPFTSKSLAMGEYVWRFQVRKGINQDSGWGVTTLVEVEFDHSDVKAESTT